jgi:hypothetical protein
MHAPVQPFLEPHCRENKVCTYTGPCIQKTDPERAVLVLILVLDMGTEYGYRVRSVPGTA